MQYIQEIKNLDRAIEIAKSIKNIWIEPYEDKIESEYGISFGSDNGYVVYNYCSTLSTDIFDFLKEFK